MEFKEVVKIRRRICDYYEDCDDCPIGGFSPNCVGGLLKVENTDSCERILEEWVKEHPVMTNADKFIEVLKNIFGGAKLNKKQVRMCVKAVVGLNVDCNTTHCSECMKWWDEEYKEPAKEKEQ